MSRDSYLTEPSTAALEAGKQRIHDLTLSTLQQFSISPETPEITDDEFRRKYVVAQIAVLLQETLLVSPYPHLVQAGINDLLVFIQDSGKPQILFSEAPQTYSWRKRLLRREFVLSVTYLAALQKKSAAKVIDDLGIPMHQDAWKQWVRRNTTADDRKNARLLGRQGVPWDRPVDSAYLAQIYAEAFGQTASDDGSRKKGTRTRQTSTPTT